MTKMIRIDTRALWVILNALNEKTGEHINLYEIGFVSAINTKLGYAVIFRLNQRDINILISVFTDVEDDLRYITADMFYTDHVDSIKMTYTKLCSLMEELK